MTYLVSPTERNPGRGISSSVPEKYGVDFLIITRTHKVGVQRKEFPDDFFASKQDGRLAREFTLMACLDYALLVVEGQPYYTTEGNLMNAYYSSWTKRRVRNLLRSVKIRGGIDVEWSDNVSDTLAIVDELEKYFRKERHGSILTRPKNREHQDEWGAFNQRDFARYFLQGFPGIGARTAEGIFDHFGRVPLKWDCSEQELMEVYGIGRKTAKALFGAMGTQNRQINGKVSHESLFDAAV